MRVLLGLLLLLSALTNYSSATYCLCRDGIGDRQLQSSLDYACGAGADCTPILQNGACYQPNTVKSHCDWAVNSYFQRAGQVSGSCNFSSTAAISTNPPPTVVTGCVYPSSPSNAGTPTSTTPPGTNGSSGTNVFPGTPVLGPTGVTDQGNGATSLYISSYALPTLWWWFSALVFLWGQ
ncbi:PREDICTED: PLASMODESMATA CALLOSE-BINDING PROTEIN 3-like [Tarenaya hassleriana]|uniref:PLASMODESMATA CALLOSE-BINDING PROTEIN 3-like n=1 Tax=Tarenaya hassleriana TaxID=28532 RepID=UPI00053C7BBA|nr:PREDICTED: PLASMODESMATA CALLOSE-BINDING PROTEIN 3-like [Tarenaya hassleriana]